MKILLGLIFSIGLLADTALIGRPVATNTQAVMRIRTDQSLCTAEVSESPNFVPLVNDLDESKGGARTTATRPDWVQDGGVWNIVVGRRTSVPVGGRFYSLALQTATDHYVRVTCGSDPTVVTTFRTDTPVQGSALNELPPFHSGGAFNYAWPTLDLNDQKNSAVVDPLTGVLIKPALSAAATGRARDQQKNWSYLLRGANWTNPSNLLTGAASRASAPTTGDDVFLAASLGSLSTTDSAVGYFAAELRLRLLTVASDGTAANRELEVCWSLDSGATCAGPWYTVSIPRSSSGSDVKTTYFPSNWPTTFMQGWGLNQQILYETFLTSDNAVAFNGSTVTPANQYSSFSPTWPAGSKLRISGSSCVNEICTLAAVQNPGQLMLVEDAGSGTGTLTNLNSGVRIRKKNGTGTIEVGAQFDWAASSGISLPGNGGYPRCHTETFDLKKNADGTAASAPYKKATLCVMESEYFPYLFALISETGETRMISYGLNINDADNASKPAADQLKGDSSGGVRFSTSFVAGDARSVYAVASTNQHGVYVKATYTGEGETLCGGSRGDADDGPKCYAGPSQERPGWPFWYMRMVEDKMRYTVLTKPSEGKAPGQAITRHPNYNACCWGASGVDLMGVFGTRGLASIQSNIPNQDWPRLYYIFDLTTGNLLWTASTAFDPFSDTEVGVFHGGQHSVSPVFPDFMNVDVNAPHQIFYDPGEYTDTGDPGKYFSGPFKTQVMAVWRQDLGKWCGDVSAGADPSCPSTMLPDKYARTECSSDIYTILKTGFGNVKGAAGNNCMKIRLKEPCSYNAHVESDASKNEASAYPCPWAPGDNTKSRMVPLQPGVKLLESCWRCTVNGTRMSNSGDAMLVTKVTNLTPGDDGIKEIEFRAESVDHGAPRSGHLEGWWIRTHPSGGEMLAMQSPTRKWLVNPPEVVRGVHYAAGQLSPGRYVRVSAGGSSILWNLAADLSSYEVFSKTFPTVPNYPLNVQAAGQSYPSYTPSSAPLNERVWYLDYNHINPGIGSTAENPSLVCPLGAPSLVAGQTHTWKLAGTCGSSNLKVYQMIGTAGSYLLKDVSAPASTINDSSGFAWCYAYQAGECRPESQQNDVYASVPGGQTSLGNQTGCFSNTSRFRVPCVSFLPRHAGMVTQNAANRQYARGESDRPLTMALGGPFRQYQYSIATKDGVSQWVFAASPNVNGRRIVTGTTSGQLILAKLPPWKEQGNANAGFSQVEINVPALNGVSVARVRFGYNTEYHCSSRLEACVTSANKSPYAFEQSDTDATWQTCNTGCTINVPAIRGRVMYWEVQIFDGSTWTVLKRGVEAVM
jgi:hypothetical protein